MLKKITIFLDFLFQINGLYSQNLKEFPHIKQVTIYDKVNDSVKVRNIEFYKYDDDLLIEKIEVDSSKSKTSKYLYYYDSNKYLIKTDYLINDSLVYYTKQYKIKKKEIIKFYLRKSQKRYNKFVLKAREIKEHKSETYVVEKERYRWEINLHYMFLGFNNRVYHKYYDNDFLYFYKVAASWGDHWGYSSEYIVKIDNTKSISYSIDSNHNFIEKHIDYYDEYENLIKSELYLNLNDLKPAITTEIKILYE